MLTPSALSDARRALVVPALGLMIAVAAIQLPVTLYGASVGDFHFGLVQLLPVWLVAGALAFMASLGLTRLLARRLGERTGPSLWALAIWTWLSGNLVTFDFGRLTGAPLSFADKRGWVLPELLLAAAVLGAAYWWSRRSPWVARKIALVALVVVALQAGLALWGDLPKRRALTVRPSSALARFAPQGNVLVVLLDAFQGDIFAELVAEDVALAGRFDGFEFFANTLGVARTTALTMPAVHTGLRYEEGWTLEEYYERARPLASFLGQAARAGHEVTVVNPFGFCSAEVAACYVLDRLVGSPWLDLASEALLPLDLALFRVAPLPVKREIYGHGRWLLLRALRVHPGRQQQERSFELLRRLSAEAAIGSGPPTVKFLHLPTPHTPLVATEDCTLLARDLPKNRANMLHQARCALLSVADFLDSLRRLGVFDSALVVLMSDHGAGLASTLPRAGTDDSWRELIGAANPLLLVKFPDAKGPLRTSQRAVQIDDVGKTVCAAVPGCGYGVGQPLSFRGGPRRLRYYLDYRWRTDFWYDKGRIDVARWEVRGPVRNTKAWRRVESSLE